MEYTQIDLKIVCRTCKCEAWEMKPLYYRDPESGKEDPRLDEMLMTCTSVQVNTEDGLPKLICRSCYLQLKNAFFFKKQCEKTDLFLRGYLKWLKDQESSGRDVEFTANLPGDNNRSGNSLGKSGDKHIDYIEQCEKTDLFFGDYLKWLKEQESSTGEVELTPNLTGDESVSGSSPGKSDDKNMDYIKVVDNNLTIYECKTCSKAFYTLEGLNCHKKMHTSKAFKCKQCDRSFTKLNQLQKHELLHTRRKKHVCKICNKTLPTQMHLKRHSAIHSKETPYSCPNCNCIFKLPEHLHTHAKSCKSEKVYVCDICKKEFADENSMEIHKREHGNREHALATVDNLNNIKEHCIKIEFDDTASVISELSDGKTVMYKQLMKWRR
ncbi:Zinc-finger associated domain (zf-AD) [Popillia japonica]|uniref:Zinc-finger associated domain (Zf-AD) n=1 Tax=Popillia japonica TaxID=7064 RepID=A0AAW1JBK4_POPJA